MKSFQIRIANNFVVTAANNSLNTWGTVGQYFWNGVWSPNGNTSVFNITGFKNVNIYGMNVVGFCRGDSSSATKSAIVSDWNFRLVLNGTPPLISGLTRVTPNDWSIITSGSGLLAYNLSKYTPSVMMSDPITSVTSITFDLMYASGIGAQFLNEVALNYNLTFTFYYDYEGENE